MEPTTSAMQDRLEALAPRLRKYAASHTGTRYAEKLADMDFGAQDLYQIAVIEILTSCKPTDNDTYMLRLGNWRMKNETSRGRVDTARYTAKFDFDMPDAEDEDGLTITDLTDQPEEALVRRELVRRLNDIIRNMKPEYADIISMISDGKTQREIAAELGVTQTSIGNWLKKIRQIFTEAGLSPALVMA